MSEKIIDKKSVAFVRAIENVTQLQQWVNEQDFRPSLVFAGRSNVGKSSLINALFGAKTSKTSKTPGRTKNINVFKFQIKEDNVTLERDFYFFDLPGYGHAEVSKAQSKQWNQLMGAFFSIVTTDDLIISIQDARHPHQKSDQQFLNFIQQDFIKAILVLNKSDKLKNQSQRHKVKQEMLKLSKIYSKMSEMHLVSAEKKTNVDTLKDNLLLFLESNS